jgi:hypothetical protein
MKNECDMNRTFSEEREKEGKEKWKEKERNKIFQT